MKTNKVIAIFGYNNSRIYDVKKIRDLANSRHDAEILLVKEDITPLDRDIAPHCFDHKPEDPNITSALGEFLHKNGLQLIGCLPFSDKGVVGAAHVAKDFGLFGDDSISAEAMLDKFKFRKLEAEISIDETKYKKPFFYVLNSAEELFKLLNEVKIFFLKPVAEGNSRGCMQINNTRELQQWLEENSSCLKNGVICEEVLSTGNEFSFDGINNNYWITQKFTTSGAFRAEYQHIVPAPLAADTQKNIHAALEPLLTNLGSRGGAFHHEFFILPDSRVASVEPNRRPAGMWIWDLANWSFKNFNPWEQWLNVCVGKNPKKVQLQRKYFSGVRGIISTSSGKIASIDRAQISQKITALLGNDDFRLSYLKDESSQVRDIPRDNSDFLAFIAIKNSNYDVLLKNLERCEEIILEAIKITP